MGKASPSASCTSVTIDGKIVGIKTEVPDSGSHNYTVEIYFFTLCAYTENTSGTVANDQIDLLQESSMMPAKPMISA